MSDVYFELWLLNVVRLFSDTLEQICAQAVFRLFLGALLFLTLFSLLANMARQGRKGGL